MITSILALLGIDPATWQSALTACRSMSLATLRILVGQLSNPSKMSWTSYGLPTSVCNVGGKLRSVVGSVCSSCYAHDRGAYAWKGVRAAYQRRLDCYQRDPILWAAAMVTILKRVKGKRAGYHRWHDSGDIIDMRHGLLLCLIAASTPRTKYWCPTKESSTVAKLRAASTVPRNLVLRVSAPMIDATIGGVATSMATSNGNVPKGTRVCPAPKQGGHCDGRNVGGINCHACWNPSVARVAYHVH